MSHIMRTVIVPSAPRGVLAAALAVMLLGGARADAAVTDNFSDLDDTANPAWTHLDGYVGGVGGRTWDASTGQYRMTALNNGLQGFGFIGSYVQPSFTDVTVAADIVSFRGSPAGAAFGIGARLNGVNTLGGLSGYAYAYEPFTGEMVLYQINPGVDIDDIGSQPVTLDPTKDYRFVLDIQGVSLHGQVFEIGGGLVAERFFVDNEAPFYLSGFSGLIAYSQNPVPPVDVTWDNFSTNVPEPATAVLGAMGVGAILLRRRVRRGR